MLWALRRIALKRIPVWYVKLKLKVYRVKYKQYRLLDHKGRLRGRIVDMLIKDYLKELLFVDKELLLLYEKIKQEKDRLVRENIRLAYEVMRKMNVKEEDWDEALSWALEGLYYAVESWDEEYALSTIAYQWIISKLQDFFKHRTKHFALPYSKEINEEEEDSFELFLGVEDNFEERADFRILLSKLPEEERKVLLLVFWEGYNAVEVARIFGCPPHRIRNLLQKALKRLKYYLAYWKGTLGSQNEVRLHATL